MIGHLKGKIISKSPPEVLLEVQGIGYEVLCPMSTIYELDNLSDDVLLFTHLSIKEDAHTLFCLLYTSPSPRDRQKSRMPSSA